MESALLWYDLYKKLSKSLGLIINPYERFIANSVIYGKPCKIAWYADGNKVSHVEEKVNIKITEKIDKHFGKISVLRGTKHKLLGIDIEFLENGKVLLLMKDYIEKSIALFNKNMDATVSSQENKFLQNVNENEPILNK